MDTKQMNIKEEVPEIAFKNLETCKSKQSKIEQAENFSVRPEFVIPIHDQQFEFNLGTSHVGLPGFSNSDTAKKRSSSSISKSLDSSSYPGIPFQVAHYICEASPDLLNQVEAALHGTSSRKKVANPVMSTRPAASPFFHMCSTTDALALQESVIDGGSRDKQATPDVVAQVVANVHQRKLIDVELPCPNATHSSGPPRMFIEDKFSARTTNDNIMPNQKEAPSIKDELVVLEKESASSECFELESNFSECVETQSCMSEYSFTEDEGFHPKFGVYPQEICYDRPADFKQSVKHDLELLRSKASLEGQLEALQMQLTISIKDRELLQMQLASMKTHSTAQASLIVNLQKEEESLHSKMDKLERKLRESEDFTSQLSCHLASKSEEVLQGKAEWNLSEKEAQQSRILLTELRVEAESKDSAIRALKGKVAELHVELQNLLEMKTTVNSELTSVKNQLVSEQKMKDWYKLQLQESQATKGKVQQEVIALQNAKADLEILTDKLTFERDQAKKHLAEFKERVVSEKEGMLRHLQTIESDMQERESSFRQFHADMSDEAKFQQIRNFEEEITKLRKDKMASCELEQLFKVATAELESKASVIAELEKHLAEQAKQVIMLQNVVHEKELERHSVMVLQAQHEEKIKELMIAAESKDNNLAHIKAEKNALELELRAVQHEKMGMDDTLTEVRNNILKLDTRLRQMKEELTSKITLINQLKEEKLTIYGEASMKGLVIEDQKKTIANLEGEIQTLTSVTSKTGSEDNGNYSLEIQNYNGLQNQEHEAQTSINANCLESSPLSKLPGNIDATTSVLDSSTQTELYEASEESSSHFTGTKKLSHVESELQAMQERHKEQCCKYESKINFLTKKLRAAIKSSKEHQTTTESLREQLANLTYNNSESVISERELLQATSKSKDALITKLKRKLAFLESKLSEVQFVAEQERRRADENQQVIVDLEKEKSKIQTFAENSYSQTSPTTNEQAINSTQVNTAELDLQSKSMEVWKQVEHELQKSLKVAKERLMAEQEKGQDLRKQVFNKKLESMKLEKDVGFMKEELQKCKQLQESKSAEISDLEHKLEEQYMIAAKLRAEMGELQGKLSKSVNEVTNLKETLEKGKANDPVLADQIKTLGWHLQQKNQDFNILKEKQKQMESHFQSEMKVVNQVLLNAKQELDSVKAELENTLQEKIDVQSKLTEMRTALNLSFERNKTLQAEYKTCLSAINAANKVGGSFSDLRLEESPAPYDESLIISLLQQSASLPENRPLSNLHVCLTKLKQEMVILQQQILEQADPKS